MTGGEQRAEEQSERSWLRLALRHLATPVIAGLVLAVLAPFGTAYYAVPVRLLYWVSLTLAGGLGAFAAQLVLRRVRADAGMAWRIAAMTVGATAFVAPFVFFLFGDAWQAVGLTLFYIAVISAVISTVGELSGRAAAPVPPVGTRDQRPALLDRLPPRFRDSDLHAVSSEDHYVRVHTSVGEHMLLMRLSDAQDLAAPTVGLKPHRSWWVAEGGARDVRKAGERWIIALPSGTEVPVSRSGVKVLREAGWI